jgi:uncharacterized membrane protein YccF (DUF307 family)
LWPSGKEHTHGVVGNLLWFVFGGGFFAWLAWFLSGILLAITIVGIPFAKAAFRISVFAAFPFGRQLVTRGWSDKSGSRERAS